MAFKPQTKYKTGKKVSAIENFKTEENSSYFEGFLKDWEPCRDRHFGQSAVIKSVIKDKMQYVFYRAGRKGAKTTTGIDIAWVLANQQPNRVGYLCYPTIAQGIEVVWEERRLQTCDRKDDLMQDKYVTKTDDTRHILRFNNGSFVKVVGTWTEARGRGTQPDFLIYDEFQDCSPEYIEAADSNMAAKEHAQCIIMGTPPKKRNHYEEWWTRVMHHPRGKNYHFTSYDNTSLDHLKLWLDNKKIELMGAKKEDVWLREYMAEFCYSSSDRVLPDVRFYEKNEFYKKVSLFSYADRIPVMAVSIHDSYYCVMLSVILARKMVFVAYQMVFPNVFNTSFSQIHPEVKSKVLEIQNFCGKKIRNIVWDESESFMDVVSGFSKCRKDVKWQDRGIPLLREMILKDKIVFSQDVADLGLECQNMLVDESMKDVQKNYPRICTLSMMTNEFFSQEKTTIHKPKLFDKYEGFREMGIPIPKNNRKKPFIFGF